MTFCFNPSFNQSKTPGSFLPGVLVCQINFVPIKRSRIEVALDAKVAGPGALVL
jgi:hypothetical protein